MRSNEDSLCPAPGGQFRFRHASICACQSENAAVSANDVSEKCQRVSTPSQRLFGLAAFNKLRKNRLGIEYYPASGFLIRNHAGTLITFRFLFNSWHISI
jgi:hypothetical protein